MGFLEVGARHTGFTLFGFAYAQLLAFGDANRSLDVNKAQVAPVNTAKLVRSKIRLMPLASHLSVSPLVGKNQYRS